MNTATVTLELTLKEAAALQVLTAAISSVDTPEIAAHPNTPTIRRLAITLGVELKKSGAREGADGGWEWPR